MSKVDLNIALNDFRKKEFREAAETHPETFLDGYHLTDEQRRAIQERDWFELARLGASTVTLGKMRRALGYSLMGIGAEMRKMTPEQLRSFLDDQQARNIQFASLQTNKR